MARCHLFQQCGVGQVVHAKNLLLVCHACLPSCISQCLLPAAFAAPLPAAFACPVRWLQHITASKRTCMRPKFTTSSWILKPDSVCVCLCECVFVYVLRHTYFVKFARIVTLYYLNLLKSRLKGFQNGSFLEGLSKMALGLIFIVYMSTLKSFWMYLIVLCLYIYVCVQKRAQDGEKGKVCMWLSA